MMQKTMTFRDAAGMTRAVISEDKTGVTFALFDQDEDLRAEVTMDATGAVRVVSYDAEGRPLP